MKNARNLLGTKFYPRSGGELDDIVRVVNVVDNDHIIVQSRDGEKATWSPDKFTKKYMALDPDGIITVAIVEVGKDENGKSNTDVIVSYNASLGKGRYESRPNVVCRQSIVDVFNELIHPGDSSLVGMSVTPETCPANVPYEAMMACNAVLDGQIVRTYITDDLDDILSMVKSKNMDVVLSGMLKKHAEASHKFYSPLLPSLDGWCCNLKELLTSNNFGYDLDQVRNIIDIDRDFSEVLQPLDDDTYTLPQDIENALTELLRLQVSNSIVVEYDHDVDLKQVKTDYVFIRDNKNKLYLVSYTGKALAHDADLSKDQFKMLEDLGFTKFSSEKYS